MVGENLLIIGPPKGVEFLIKFGDFDVLFVEELVEAFGLVDCEWGDYWGNGGVREGVV